MKLFTKKNKLPQYFIKKFKLGKVSWFVRADILDYNLNFTRKVQAETYRQMLKASVAKIESRVERVQVDDETGIHITYPQSED